MIDGYKDESFSVNWGWGGYCDGFYRIGALNPEADGKPLGDQYNSSQAAVFALQPSDGKEVLSNLRFIKVDGYLETMNMNVTDVKAGKSTLLFTLPILAQGEKEFTGEIAVALKNAAGETREVFAPLKFNLPVGYYTQETSVGGACSVDAQEGDYLAVVSKEDGTDEYVEIYGPDMTEVHVPATGFQPRTFEVKAELEEGAEFIEASSSYNLNHRFYNGKPLQGCPYYFDVKMDESVTESSLELDGGEVPVYQFRDGAKFYGISVGIKPVYNLVVKTTTGIRSLTVNNKTRKSALYDLNGRRIPNVPSKGIYIQNGKKMIRK